jgi:putative transposase
LHCSAGMLRYPEHLRSFSYLGPHRYSLTFCTYERHRHFTDAARVKLVKEQVLRSAQEESFAVLAYCFMPDHLHLVVHGTSEDADLKRFIARAKQFSGYHYQQAFRARLWQRYGYERALRESEPTATVVKYLLENPLRAGLVDRVEDYPFLGSFEYSRETLMDFCR